MAVLIKGMNMPETCSECILEPISDAGWFFCQYTKQRTEIHRDTGRLPDCPLKETKEPKPRESRAKLPCPECGRKHLSIWTTTDGKIAIACDECKIASAWSKTEIGAIRDWNEVVRKWTE